MITFFLSWNKIYSLAYEKKKKKVIAYKIEK